MKNLLTFKIKDREREGRGSLTLIMVGQWINLPVLMIGGLLIESFSFAGLVFCIVAGGAILLACAVFMGMRSCKSGLPSTIVSAEGLGVQGARYISALLISITGVGWFGLQAALCGASLSVMAEQTLGITLPTWGVTLFFGALMALSAMYGYRTLKYLFSVIEPILIAVLLFTLVYRMRFSGAVVALSAWRPAQSISYIQGIGLVVGLWAMGTFIAGDFARYAKKPRDAAIGLAAGLAPAIPAVILSGAIFRILEGTHDITAILNSMGFPAIALVFLILATWVINMTNVYSGGIAISVLLGLPEKRLKLTTALAGGIGAVLGAAGILSRFTDFLSLLGSLVPPVIGVLIGVRFSDLFLRLTGRTGLSESPSGILGGLSAAPKMPDGDLPLKPGVYLPGVIAYAVGALTAWLTGAVYTFFIPPLNGIVIAAAVYVLMNNVFAFKTKK